MVLYGAGRQKSEVKQAVRKVSRHLTKLVQNKMDLDDKSGINCLLTPNVVLCWPIVLSLWATKSYTTVVNVFIFVLLTLAFIREGLLKLCS